MNKKVIMLMTPSLMHTRLVKIMKTYLTNLGCEVKVTSSRKNYVHNWHQSDNIVTWGVRWKTSQYTNNGTKNVLFFENALMSQKLGSYVDHEGFFVDSSMVTSGENHSPHTEEELNQAIRIFKNQWGWRFGRMDYNKDGPILIAMQMNGDAPMRYHFPLANSKGINNRKGAFVDALVDFLPRDREIILRTHPKQSDTKFLNQALPDNWTINNKGSIYKVLEDCSGLVTVNSTMATEAQGLQLPIATFGHGAFTGSNTTLDCSENPSLVANLLDFKPNLENSMNYLSAVMRHQLPYKGDYMHYRLEINHSFQEFVRRLK